MEKIIFFVFHLPGTESTLPSTLLANMAGFADDKLPSIFSFAKTTQSRLLETIRLPYLTCVWSWDILL